LAWACGAKTHPVLNIPFREGWMSLWFWAATNGGESTKIKSRAEALHYRKRRKTAKSLVAAATAAATASAARGAGARFGRATCDCGAEDGELDFGVFARAFGARDVLLAVDDDLFERVLAVVADVFVDGHALDPLLIKTDYSKL